jgi:cell division cycle protein 37
MISGNKQTIDVFEQDVEQTYAIIEQRAAANREENEKIMAQGGVEQIQLMPENPDTVISFDVPDGPTPADLRLDGSLEAEDLDIEEVRTALQRRWDIFEGFDPKLQKALQSGKLDTVNKALGKMPVDEAEQVVELLQIAGILQFAEGGIRDATGRGKAAETASALNP